MTQALSYYTTYDDVRAALGVSEEELEDQTLALAIYEDALEVELEEISITLPATFAAKKVLSTPTDDEGRFLQAVRLFATYAVAKHLTSSVSLFAPKQVTDGKAAATRIDDPYKVAVDNVNKLYGRFRTRLEQTLAVVTSTSATASVAKTYLSTFSPAVDPITGA